MSKWGKSHDGMKVVAEFVRGLLRSPDLIAEEVPQKPDPINADNSPTREIEVYQSTFSVRAYSELGDNWQPSLLMLAG